MPVSADAFLDEKPLSADAFLDESDQPEERPPRGESADYVEPPPRPAYSLDEPAPEGKPMVTVEGSTRATIPASLEEPRVIAPFDMAEFTRGDVATPEQQAFNAAQPRFDPFEPLVKLPHITGQIVADAADVFAGMGAMNPEYGGTMTPEQAWEEIIASKSRPPRPTEQAIAGAVNVAKTIPETFTSPVGIATLGAGLLPKVGQRAVSAAFLADMASHTPEAAERAGAASVAGDTQEKVEAYGGLGLTPLMATAVGLHAFGPGKRPTIPPQFVETVRRVDAAVPGALNRSLEAAVKKVAEPISDRPQQLAKPIEKGIPDEIIQVQEAQGPKDVLKPVENFTAAVERGEVATTEAARDFGRTVKTAEDISALKAASRDMAERGDKALNELPVDATLEQQQAAVDLSSRAQFLNEAIEAATGAYDVKLTDAKKFRELMEAGQPRNEKAIPAATEAATPAAADQTSISARQAPVVEPGVGAVPENVSGAGAQAGAELPLSKLKSLRDEALARLDEIYTSEHARVKGSEFEGQSRWQAIQPTLDVITELNGRIADVEKPSAKPAQPLPEPAGQIKAGEELLAPAASQAITKSAEVSSKLVAPETIKAAAIRAEDGTVYTGKWHPAAYEELMRDKGITKEQAIRQQQDGQVADGFLTSSGRFVSREEAATIASRADQFRPDKEGGIAFAGALKQKTIEAGPGKIAPKKTSVDLAREAASAAKAQPGTYSASAKIIADKLRAQFKTETGGKAFTGPVEIINAAVEIAAKIIEYGGSAADALAAGLKHIRQHSPADEAAFRSKFDESYKAAAESGYAPRKAGADKPINEKAKTQTQTSGATATGQPVAGEVQQQVHTAPKNRGDVRADVPGGVRESQATLEDVYQIFEPAPKESKGIGSRAGEAVESFRAGFSSKFRPLNKLAEDIAAKVGGKAKDVAGIFEQLKGSSGKAEADVYRFDKDVSDVVKGNEKDFNAYVFLRRSLDRLQQDAADITRAQAGENIPNLNRRRVSQYTIPQLEAKLTALSEQIGGEKLAQFTKAAEAYQIHMDQALRLQVESGRMLPEVYDAIKAGNQFYAPFKVMKYIEDTMRPEGSGRKVDTTADYVKAMEGIEDPNFKLGDMLAAARQNLTLSRTLAEKNRAMQNITELAALDVDGNFVRKLKLGEEAPQGLRAVNVFENGQKQRYAVNESVAEAIDALGPRSANLLMRLAASTFRAGATTFNVAFQASNVLADTPRAALVSKYGINIIPELVLYPFDVAYAKAKGIPVERINKRLAQSATRSLRFPLSLLEGIYSSFAGEVIGVKNKLMLDFLDSGIAGTTMQEYLTPGALRQTKVTTGSKVKDFGLSVLRTPMEISTAIEQVNKVAGVKQAMKAHGVESSKALPSEAITELRRFSGSPDFGRMGGWVEKYGLNIVQMFFNPRVQGGVADAGRLAGRDGMRQAASTWINLGAWVGLPSLYLYMLNHRDREAEDNYAARPKQEKQNYWLVSKTDDNGKQRYIKGSNGEQVPDYWRIPKRESAKWTGNFVEAGLDFAKDQNPETFKNWSVGLLEDMSPLNVQGKTLTERMESAASGLNPLLKAPLETATGRDLYRHRNIVPDSQKKASPEEQYDERTPDVFKTLADKMPDVAPEVFRSPKMLENMTKNFTAGLITQFLPRQPVEGRSAAENLPLTQRFQALPYTDSSEFDQRIQKFERESADEQLKRMRDAKAIMDSNKGARPDVLIKQMIEKHGRDEKLAERIVDLYVAEQRSITSQERRVLALPVTQRAEYLADELTGKTPEQKTALLRNWALKRILTERVAAELALRLSPPTPNPNP